MNQLFHLSKRFFGSVRPGPPSPIDERWAVDHLLPGEQTIWAKMNNPDRRHAVAVARAVALELGFNTTSADPENRPVMAAALLHDSGKVICGFRTPFRVVATMVWAVVDDRTADNWLEGSGFRHRLAQYRRHPELGARMLEAAGSEPITFRWAAEHHSPESSWSVPLECGLVLKSCDDD